jgi:DNA-binding PadR family transcriptional regulator
MEYMQKGIENRHKRAVRVWLKMWELYTDPVSPMTAEAISKRLKKKNGKSYTRGYVYDAFKKLEALGYIKR